MKEIKWIPLTILFLLLGFLCVEITQAQIATAQSEPRGNKETVPENLLKIDSKFVLLNVSVLDDKRNFVTGLSSSDFRVFDDQVEQRIELFAKEDVPISLGLVIDTSGSMRFKLKSVLAAAERLLELCRPGDEIFIVDMKDTTRINFAQRFTTDLARVKSVLGEMYPGGGTALLDGIAVAGKYAQTNASNRRRALIVMSDGDERDSTIKLDELREQLRELDLQVYLLGFPEGFIGINGSFAEATTNKAKKLMQKIAEESGGLALFPRSLDEIGQFTLKIGQELRTQYMMGFYPSAESRDARWHKLQVKLVDKKRKYAVRTRSGYFAQK
ncbi:MAG: VWA domain-containing protein [Acidobacteriota bacterium]